MVHLITSNRRHSGEHVYNNVEGKKPTSIQTRLATYQKCWRVLNFSSFFFNFLAHFSPLLSHYTVHKLYRKDQIGKGAPPVQHSGINLRCLIKHPFR